MSFIRGEGAVTPRAFFGMKRCGVLQRIVAFCRVEGRFAKSIIITYKRGGLTVKITLNNLS